MYPSLHAANRQDSHPRSHHHSETVIKQPASDRPHLRIGPNAGSSEHREQVRTIEHRDKSRGKPATSGSVIAADQHKVHAAAGTDHIYGNVLNRRQACPANRLGTVEEQGNEDISTQLLEVLTYLFSNNVSQVGLKALLKSIRENLTELRSL